MIDYRSDNTGRAAPQILEALLRANHDTALGYGADEWTATLQQRFSELFETSVRVFPVATGTAANALALASLGPSWGIVYCSEVAHVNNATTPGEHFYGVQLLGSIVLFTFFAEATGISLGVGKLFECLYSFFYQRDGRESLRQFCRCNRRKVRKVLSDESMVSRLACSRTLLHQVSYALARSA